MRHETSLFRLRSLAALAALLGLSCRDARPAGDIRADFPAYCRATMACEGDNADAMIASRAVVVTLP